MSLLLALAVDAVKVVGARSGPRARELVALTRQELELRLLFGDAPRRQSSSDAPEYAAACSTSSRRFSRKAAMRSSISAMVNGMPGMGRHLLGLRTHGPGHVETRRGV